MSSVESRAVEACPECFHSVVSAHLSESDRHLFSDELTIRYMSFLVDRADMTFIKFSLIETQSETIKGTLN